MNDEEHGGGCLCGHVGYKVKGKPSFSSVWHCRYCQLRTTSAFALFLFLHILNQIISRSRWVALNSTLSKVKAIIVEIYIFVLIVELPFITSWRFMENWGDSLALIVGPSIRQPFGFHPQVRSFAGQKHILLAT